ncbi:Gag polyprotein [Chelydra serpentina]|uniref:Gag polyprotein n=1 Tax=Chelydra serpentina TaxID=8475 RepID=A0A8T1S6E6_CHESE|nr:Gag polyprotein [Chelydra serpentina]
MQKKKKHPSDFYKKLYKAFCIYTNIDPKAADTQSTVRLIFISQSAPDIKKQLQRLKEAKKKSLEELVSVATIYKIHKKKYPKDQQETKRDPQVHLALKKTVYSCLLNSKAALSTVTTKPKEKSLTNKNIPVMGIGKKPFYCSILQKATVKISNISVSHAFLLEPNSPVNLLGKNLLYKLRAQIFFSNNKIIVWLPQRQLPQLCAALT